MRDYADIGWKSRHGASRDRIARTRLNRLWRATGSTGATVVLLLVIAGLLVLDAASSGSTLPIEDPTRFVPIGLRVLLVLLGVNLVSALLQRVVPALAPHAAHAADLTIEGAWVHRMPVPFTPEDVSLAGSLEDAGAEVARPVGQRRGFGVTGRTALAGAVLAVAGGACLLATIVLGLDDPAPGKLILREGEETEVVRYEGGETQHLDAFPGYAFMLLDSAAIAAPLRKTVPYSNSARLQVTNLTDGSAQQLAVHPESRFGMPDGTNLLVNAVRQIGRPSGATLRVVEPSGATHVAHVSLGGLLTLAPGRTVEVGSLTLDYPGVTGAAVQLVEAEGEVFWVFQARPWKAVGRGALDGTVVELLAVSPGYEVVMDKVAPQRGELVTAGLLLLLLGAALLATGRHRSIEVIDELDRVLLRGTSVNDAVGIGAVLEATSERLARSFSDAARDEAPASSGTRPAHKTSKRANSSPPVKGADDVAAGAVAAEVPAEDSADPTPEEAGGNSEVEDASEPQGGQDTATAAREADSDASDASDSAQDAESDQDEKRA